MVARAQAQSTAESCGIFATAAAPVWRRRRRRRKMPREEFLPGKQHDAIAVRCRPAGPDDAAGAATGASAQAYPTKPVSLLIAFPPGGPSDVLSRVVGKKLEQILGQPFIMDNRPGAGGNIAAEAAAHAAADGHTILMGNNSILATNAALYKKVNFDPEQGFRADQPDRLAGQHPGGQSRHAGEVAGGADRAAARQSRQVQLRVVRPRHRGASRGRAVQGRGQGRRSPTFPTRAARRRCRT